ncbi:MAG: hypothetical protein KZQ64_05955 [gamma proteobacterium symbiont of Bathyaustriella thionipta]|nr:hypothetical protein [gamma proteobacterium symbiont of Bathyaustriella thionipta]MCU7949719.1 hypothetical protein [gamma proteobacterium symbiont of Bathyaustriella thionipta]MCU7952921.1 hypothetical protein [gamma proteobacterium symbiont of Bathyaustriella thionipta]MCU7956419.1 hypothetical protein [gamma proteobacterium symbiont of Bathyaustriella thionipta]MCU7967538.1 hypothetical protein [gamma proteobacterium symbiont of Bathyaustriella thionipta]
MNTKTLTMQLLKNIHWLLVSFFAIAWLSGDDWLSLHVFSGYGILLISAVFLLKQLFTRQIFGLSKPAFNINWLKSNLVLIILPALILASITGILADSSGNDFFEEFHEISANFSLLIIAAHIALKVLKKLKRYFLILEEG